MADPTSPSHPVSTRVMAVAVLGAAVVIVPAAIASYAHMHQLAVAAGEDWLAWLAPLPTDGMVVFASTLLYAQHYRLKQSAHWLVVPAIILGVLASIGANVLSEKPDLVDPMWLGIIVRAWPPLALAIVADLAWQLLGLRGQDVPQDVPQDGSRTLNYTQIGKVQFGPENIPGGLPGNTNGSPQEHHPGLPAGRPEILPGNTRRPSRKKAREASRGVSDDDLMVFVRKLRDDLDGTLTGYAVRKALQDDGHRIGNDRAGRLAERALAEVG